MVFGGHVLHGREQVVAQLGEVLGLPVVGDALRLGFVEVGLHLDVGLLAKQVHDPFAERAERRDGLVDAVEVAAVADGHRADLLAVPLRGHERRRRSVEQKEPDGELAGRFGGDCPVGAQDLVGALERPGDQPAVDGRADLVQAERKRCDDAEVGAGAPPSPEQVGVLVAAGAPHAALGGHQLDLEQVVDRPPEPARQIAKAASERQAGDADLGDEAQRRR
jgi:hypothetical protein